MFLFPTLRNAPFPSRLTPCLVALVAAVPVGWMAAQIAAVSRDIAYWDEIDSAIALLLRLDSGMGAGDFLQSLFSVTNEHRTVTSRLIFAASYWLSGSIDFHWIGVIGNEFLAAACGLLILGVEGAAARLRLAAVLALVLFQLENYESFFWSGSSIDHFQVVALAAGAMVALARGTRWALGAAAICGVLATFTLAHGLVVWPAGSLLLIRERRWRALGVWSGVAAAAATVFFWGFAVNQAHQFAGLSWPGIRGVLHYWCTLLGAPIALGHATIAPWCGGALLAATAVWSWRGDWSRHRATLPVVWFVLGATALIAIGRAEVSHGEVYSRYMVLGGIGWALLLFAAIERWSRPEQPFGVMLCCLPVLVAFNLAANRAYRERAETFVEHRDRAALRYRQHFADGKGPVALHPVPTRATAVLSEAARRGLYRIPRICLRREFPEAKPSARINYFVDEFSLTPQSVYVAGWAAIPDEAIHRGELHLVLRSASDFLIYSTVQVRRPDVVQAFNEPRWRMAGFRAAVRRTRIPPGEYNVGFLIGDEDDAEYILTDHKLKLAGPIGGEAVLAGQ